MESHPRHFLLTKPYTNQELHGRYPVIVVRPHSFYCIYVQASHAGMQKFSLLQLVTVGVVSATVEELTLSRATEQYCAAGATLKPLCLSKQLTLCSQQHIDQLFPGHIVQVV